MCPQRARRQRIGVSARQASRTAFGYCGPRALGGRRRTAGAHRLLQDAAPALPVGDPLWRAQALGLTCWCCAFPYEYTPHRVSPPALPAGFIYIHRGKK